MSMSKELFNVIASEEKMDVKVRRLKELLTRATAEDINAYHDVGDIWTGKVTILHIAAAMGQLEILDLLVRNKKTDLEATTGRNGRTALHVAAGFDQLEACQLLVKYINPLVKTTSCKTAFRTAKEKSALQRTPEKIARAKAVMEFLKVPTFVQACYEGDSDLVTKMVTEEQVDVNGKYHVAIRGKESTRETKEKWGLLGACLNGHVDVIEFLLTLIPRLNVNLQDRRGYTILHFIAQRPVKNFPENVPQLTDCSMDSPTVAYYITEMLIKVGRANPNIKDAEGFPPMYDAIGSNSLDVVKALVRSGAAISWEVIIDPKQVYTSEKLYHKTMSTVNKLRMKDCDYGPAITRSGIDLNSLQHDYQDAIQQPMVITCFSSVPLGMPEMRRYILMLKSFDIGQEFSKNFRKIDSHFFPAVRERASLPHRPEPLTSKLLDVTAREFKVSQDDKQTSKLVC